MTRRLIILFTYSLLGFSLLAQTKRIPIIFDSDMGPDYDDAGAITMLHAFADKNEIKILATIASTKYKKVAGVINVFNTFYNRPGIPVAVPKGKAIDPHDFRGWTDSIYEMYPHKIKSNDEVPDAVALYRKILAAQPDHSIVIITIGFLTNISNLLQSKADIYSKMDGVELMRHKVKRMVCMAGGFPSGNEYNVNMDAAAAQYAFVHCPVPVLFSGFEIGQKIKSGLPLIHNEKVNSPVKDVFRISLPRALEDSAGRMSWDETAVLVAVRGYKSWYTIKKGRIIVADNGSNTWQDDEKGMHSYLVETRPPSEVQTVINDLLMHMPANKKR
ncbi:MAG: nucleoside hydrolase [Bacteroidetes bacterium]|nr:nucleoside hydrolase [Bacteroidota bacterium]